MNAPRDSANPYGYSVAQNLRDAGCPRKLVEQFFQLTRQEDRLELLSRYRKSLLDEIHRDEGRIQRLDYLVYRMEKDVSPVLERPAQDTSQSKDTLPPKDNP